MELASNRRFFRWILDVPTFLATMIMSMLTSFSCLSFFNSFLQWCGTLFGFYNFGLVPVVTYLFIPVLYVLGIPWSQILHFSEVFAIKLLTFHQENYSSMNESKLELLMNILAQNNINIHITFAILGLMVAIKNLENNSLLKISSVSGIIKSIWSAILALFLTTAIINSVEI